MQASQSIRTRVIAALIGAAVAASLTVATMAVRQSEADLAARKGYGVNGAYAKRPRPLGVLAAGQLTGAGKPVR